MDDAALLVDEQGGQRVFDDAAFKFGNHPELGQQVLDRAFGTS